MADKPCPTSEMSSRLATASPQSSEIARLSDRKNGRLVLLGRESRSFGILNAAGPNSIVSVPATSLVAIIRGETPKFVCLKGLLNDFRIAPSSKEGTAIALTLGRSCVVQDWHLSGEAAMLAEARREIGARKPSRLLLGTLRHRGNGLGTKG